MKKHSKTTTEKRFTLIPLNNWDPDLPKNLDYTGLSINQDYDCYEPPINRLALAKLPAQNAQHCGILNSRSNMIAGDYESGCLSKMDMRALCLNLIQFGDVGLLKIRNAFGKVVKLVTLSSLYLRKRREGGYSYLVKKSLHDTKLKWENYAEEDIIFIKIYDPIQQVYGMPDYIGGIQSALLNSEATVFRRKYFKNGSHLGFILYTTDPDLTEDMEDEIKKSLKDSKGVGNFKSLFVNSPNGHPDGLKVIPIGDTGKKDEFANIKNISAQDILTAHRYPPGLSGIIPEMGSFGDPIKIRQVYKQDEVIPMQEMIAHTINTDPDIAKNANLHVIFRKPELINNS